MYVPWITESLTTASTAMTTSVSFPSRTTLNDGACNLSARQDSGPKMAASAQTTRSAAGFQMPGEIERAPRQFGPPLLPLNSKKKCMISAKFRFLRQVGTRGLLRSVKRNATRADCWEFIVTDLTMTRRVSTITRILAALAGNYRAVLDPSTETPMLRIGNFNFLLAITFTAPYHAPVFGVVKVL